MGKIAIWNAVVWGCVILAEAIVIRIGDGNDFISVLAPLIIGFFVSEMLLVKKS